MKCPAMLFGARLQVATLPATATLLLAPILVGAQTTPAPVPAYCAVQTAGTKVEVMRPQPTDASPQIDDVNWFARPVPNPRNHWIVAFASHNLNYLYDLTSGARVRIPDKSDGVATPDGRFMTVPSHYTATATVNFYDLPTLLDRLAAGKDASDVPPVFAHKHADLGDGSQLTFHISKHDYLTVFVDGGIKRPAITDIVVVDLDRRPSGEYAGIKSMARVTTSRTEGVGNYFPAFFPDGKLFYIANDVPKDATEPNGSSWSSSTPRAICGWRIFFADDHRRQMAEQIGQLWRETCAPELKEFKPGEAPWAFMSLKPESCRKLVETAAPSKTELLSACNLEGKPPSR